MSINRDKVVEDLGKLLEDAARTSIAKGAQYHPGEPITFTTEAVWQRVAKNLIKLIEVVVEEQKALEKKDG